MKTLTLAFGMAIAATGGMAHAATHEHDMSQHRAMQVAANAARHEGFGVLKAVNAKDRKVQLAHEAIADLGWPAMTMWFVLRDPLPRDLKVGDSVRFELMQGESNQWVIVAIKRK